MFRRTCGDDSCAFYVAHEAAGAAERPAFPAPSRFFWGWCLARPGQIMPRECEAVAQILDRHSGPRLLARVRNPYSRWRLQILGSPLAAPRNDGVAVWQL